MAQKCQGCRITEKYKYWSELPATNYQFFTVMPHDFQRRLQIPKKFTECFKQKLEPWCTLIGASQNKWKVKLSTRSAEDDEGSSSLAFLEGWKQYASDNEVEFGDSLVFRYVGDSSFEVSVFDKSGCEREGTLFATNASSSSARTTCNSILHRHLNYSANIISNDNSDSEDSDSDSVQEVNPREEEEESEDDPSWDEEEVDESVHCEVGDKRKKSNQEKFRQVQKYFVSKRRKLTKAEQLRATKLALKYVSSNESVPSFKLTMRPSHVYHGFHLTIPKKWAMKHMPNESHEVELRVPKDGAERSWIVGCCWTLASVRQRQLRVLEQGGRCLCWITTWRSTMLACSS